MKHSEDGWSFTTGYHESIHVDEQLKELLEILKPHAIALRNILDKSQIRAEVSVAITVEENRFPSISIDQDALRALAEMNLPLDIDIV